MGENGHHNLILKALQKVKSNGITLSLWRTVRGVLANAHDRAARSDWEEQETAKSLRFALQVVELMEEEEHHREFDWRGHPFVIAVPTELAAVAAQRHGGDVETVKTLVNRLVHALKQTGFDVSCDWDAGGSKPLLTPSQDKLDKVSELSKQTEADYQRVYKQHTALNDIGQELFQLIPIWNALKTSRAILGPDMPLAEEAAAFEDKSKTTLYNGLDALLGLEKRDGVQINSRFPRVLRDQVKRCADLQA